jgi:hypothetical protein
MEKEKSGKRKVFGALSLMAILAVLIGLHYTQTGSLPRLNDTDNMLVQQPAHAIYSLYVGRHHHAGIQGCSDLEELLEQDFECTRVRATGYIRRWGNEYEFLESGDFAIATNLGLVGPWTKLAISSDPGVRRCNDLGTMLPNDSYEALCTIDAWVALYEDNTCTLDAATIQVHSREQAPVAISD